MTHQFVYKVYFFQSYFSSICLVTSSQCNIKDFGDSVDSTENWRDAKSALLINLKCQLFQVDTMLMTTVSDVLDIVFIQAQDGDCSS